VLGDEDGSVEVAVAQIKTVKKVGLIHIYIVILGDEDGSVVAVQIKTVKDSTHRWHRWF
jgi:hypothetical protein